MTIDLDHLKQVANDSKRWPTNAELGELRHGLNTSITRIEELEATIQRVRSSHQSEDGYCVKCSEEYGLTTGTYPCPPIQALEECTQ